MSDTSSLEEQVVNKLIEKQFTISFAESCTGGLCAARIVNVPNASQVLNASFITYANEAKIHYLDVKPETIAQYGVVSEEVATQMAIGAAYKNNADIGVGITGIAGPSGATDKKPVGMVCFGFCRRAKNPDGSDAVHVRTDTRQFGSIGRQQVRESSVAFVLETLLTFLS